MRARSTWQSEKSETPRQAATSRKADIYTMNQEHPQPSPVDYESGSPDTWAETPVPADKMSVKDEYDGDHVKRNEIGMGEFRDDTWKHKDSDQWNGKGKYDNAKMAAERKAMACERLARATLRTADETLVEQAAVDYMAMPDKSLVAMLKRLDSVSPDSLPEQSKFKRALACTKLAARMLGETATPATVEKLASVVMTIDDPTLKNIIKSIASARVSQEEQQEEGGGKTSQVKVQGQQEEEEEQGSKTSQVMTQGQEEEQEEEAGKTSQIQLQGQEEQEEEQEEEGMTSQEQEAHGLSPEEMAMLDSMLKEEQAECGAPGAAPAAPGMPAPAAPPGDDLAALFSGAPAAPAMPMMASDISFDEEDDGAPAAPLAAPAPAAQVAGDLDHLFSDDPEVQAQRQIKASELEARAREGGFAGRTASAKGARKLGAVQKPAKVTADQALESIWDRP